MTTWIKHVNPTGGFFYVGPNNENRQDFNNDPLYPALKADIDSGSVTVVNWEDTQDYTDAIAADLARKEESWVRGERDRIRDIIEDLDDSGGSSTALRAYRALLKTYAEAPNSSERPEAP